MKMKALLFSLLVAPAALFACTVPVFRYALERWAPDPHLIFHAGRESSEKGAWLDGLASGSHHTNLYAMRDIEEATLAPGEVRLVFEESMIEWWRGPMDAETLERLADSPLRRELVRELLSGTSTVFVLVQSGDPETDAATETKVRSLLEKLEKILELPEAPEYDEDDPRGRSMTELPLKLEFSLLVLESGDAAEDFFRKQLHAVVEGPPEEGPVLAAVFGQGRAISLPFSMITEELLTELCWFLEGPCSCQVKALNPGYDLVLTADWDYAVQKYPEEVEHTLPSGKSFRLSEAPSAEPASEAVPPEVHTASTSQTWKLLVGGGLLIFVLGFLGRKLITNLP
ncbi:MAG: hypothetical protein JJU29_21265 [Verrucomicrobia bacterium]|nr:hypothetical protein [Verrucomicrobiota bacterium]MCH8510816.1 hypothetical protein [Kiritimatiellia bacterium]